MNYLTEIKLFNDWLETENIPSNAIVLWYALMFVANRCGWKDEFAVPFSVLENRTKLNKSTIWRMRRILAERGLISVRELGGNQSAMYRINPFERSEASHSATLTATQIIEHDAPVLQPATLTATTPTLNRVVSSEKEKTSKKGKEQERKSCAKKREPTRQNLAQFLSTLESPWYEVMAVWLEYKRTRHESYHTELGAKKCLTLLRNLSGNNAETATAIIDQSMANNWAGLFPLRSGQAQVRSNPPVQGQHPGQIIHPSSNERTRHLLEKFNRKTKVGQ